MPRGKRNAAPDSRPIEQYTHSDKDRVNIPPIGLVTPETDEEAGRQKYQYDPHLDPQLVWAGKAERTSFEVPTVSLHVHERIDPRTMIEVVRKKEEPLQPSLFEQAELPLRQAIEFYKHRQDWTNRLIAGDSLLTMNSLLVKEGMAGQVQAVYFDPPYGIKYGSNFQPFVNRRDVKDGKDEDLTQEPETLKAFRDTWELGIHSYLTYLRDRLLLARELLHESGSIFLQISDENLHLARNLMDEVFGSANFAAIISFSKAAGGLRAANRVGVTLDYIVWYFRNYQEAKYHALFERKDDPIESGYTMLELADGTRRPMTKEERQKQTPLPPGSKPFMSVLMTKPGPGSKFEVEYEGKRYDSGSRWWGTTPEGIGNVIKARRVIATDRSLRFVSYFTDFPYRALTNLWSGLGGAADPVYVVQTNPEVIQRCLLMTTDPGDLVFDPTCGSGTTAYVAEQWGRRWITCDTSRVAITLARQRLMTASFSYYELAKPQEGLSSGFRYRAVPHVTLKSIANNEPPAAETLYDDPHKDTSKTRVASPFTVEAVPAPTVQALREVAGATAEADASIARSGETVRQAELRGELLKTGIRGKHGERLRFSRVEPLSGTRFLHADAELSGESAGETSRAVISFGPEHHPLGGVQVARALEEANRLFPKPKFVIFAAYQFDPEAAQDIEETNWAGVTLLKAQMNADLQTEDLKKRRSSNESFWLIGQPDVRLRQAGQNDAGDRLYQVEVLGFDYYDVREGRIISGSADQIAVWMLDPDYDGRSLFPHQVFFPGGGDGEGWAKLAKSLKAQIDEELLEAFRGKISLPFAAGREGRAAVKIVDDRGIESIKLIDLA